ncbi:glycosyltransferase family protein [Algoriphagus machipongonensis]|uniref:Membrane protein n=1 Tax=Algoriphagus machipongonensis TaxID=388413 RepID=A3HZB3_9BACT|nr:YfhO family protein [Algoriphagus machipongonensis]EAZ80599.1 membrane protein [Algoriphagus machipongonensis]
MTIDFKKNILPHAIGVAIFYAIVAFYFSPLLLEDKVIFQGDILKWEGSAKEAMDFREATGEEALWTNSMFGGMPAYFISMEFPGDITNAVVSVLSLGLPHPINGLFLGMVGMYILLLSLKVRPTFAILGSLAFALNSYNLLSLAAGHNAKIWAECLIPLILTGVHLAFERKRILGASILALGLLLQFKFNHVQITYYTFLILGIYVIVRLIFEWKKEGWASLGKTVGILALGTFLAVGGNIGRLATALEYSKYSTRGEVTIESKEAGLAKDYAFGWSNGIMESFTLLIPDFYGGGSSSPLPKNSATETALRQQGMDPAQINGIVQGAPTYWGDQPFTGGPIYGGVILIFLAVLGIWAAPKQTLISFGVIIVFSLMLSWGKNLSWFNYFLFDYFPYYNKFRAVSMALGMTLFAIPVLGIISLEKLITEKQTKSLMMAGAVTGGLILLFIVGAGMFRYAGAADQTLPDWLLGPLREDRKSMLQSSAFRSLGFLAAAFALIYFTVKGKINDLILGAGLFVLVLADLWTINRPYLNNESFDVSPSQSYFSATPADKEIEKDTGYFRVLDLTEGLMSAGRASYRFHAIGGYHGAKMRRFQDLIDYRLSDELSAFLSKAQEGDFDFEGIQTFNMLNTKYIIAGNAANAVFENQAANGAAWIPSDIRTVTSNEEEIKVIGEINTKSTATINKEEFGQIPAGSGSIELTSHAPNKLTYSANMNQGGLAVFSEIYYPVGWTATIDGEKSEILRTDYLLRGLSLPAGQHEIEFQFAPDSYYSTKTPMIIFQYLILIGLIAGIFFTIKDENGRA